MILKTEEDYYEADISKEPYTVIDRYRGDGIGMNSRSRNVVLKEGIHLTNVTRGNSNSNKPKILFFAEWTRRMGFVPDVLIQVLPEDGGLSFILRDENIPCYSKLLRDTKDKGGSLIHPSLYMHSEHPCISLSGQVVKNAGLKYGDNLIAMYEYGLIRMRKFPDDGSMVVNARLFGRWLETFGFMSGEVLTINSEPGLITCTLQENGHERVPELVKYARKNSLNLVQLKSMQDNNCVPMFKIPLSRLEKAGFLPDDVFHAVCDYGRIQLQKLDCRRYGF